MRQLRKLPEVTVPDLPLAIRDSRSFPERNYNIIKCQNLFNILKDIIGKKHVSRTALEKLTSIKASNCNITSLEGLQYCKNLKELDLRNNLIRDLSPISNLPLSSLFLSDNCIESIEPLQSLPKIMENLFLDGNKIKDISPLEHLTRIQSLISDIAPPKNVVIDYFYSQSSPLPSEEIVSAKGYIHPCIIDENNNIETYYSLTVPQGALGVIMPDRAKVPGYIPVWFYNLYNDFWYFRRKDLEQASLSVDEAIGIIEDYQGHHCWGSQFQFNVKMYRINIPDEIKEHLSPEEISELIDIEIQVCFEEFKEEMHNSFVWLRDIYFAGRSGGWLVLDCSNNIEITIDELERFKEEINDLIDNSPEEIPLVMEDICSYATKIVDIALSLEFIESVIKHRLELLQRDLSSTGYWREILASRM